MPRGKPKDESGEPIKSIEIIENHLYLVSEEDFRREHLNGMSVFVDLRRGIEPMRVSGDILHVYWDVGDDVDEHVLDGLVHLCAYSMKGDGNRVLIAGSFDAVDTVAACVLREYMGCAAPVALSILRRERPGSLMKQELVETVVRYKPS